MDLEELEKIIERSTRSAFRLEALPQYLVDHEADEFAAWKAGKPWPLFTPETSPWLAYMQSRTQQGYRWYRVHILDYPLSEYTRFELRGYQALQAVGEEIYLVDRRAHPELEGLREDFWLIDDDIVARMIYDEEGHFIRPEHVDHIDPYREMRDMTLRHAKTLDDYTSRKEVQGFRSD